MKRPSPKELNNKIKAAQDSIDRGRVALLNQTVMACDAIELDYDIELELLSFLPECLYNRSPLDYAGQNPPQKAYAPEISGLELFAFKITKGPFGFPVYIKYAHADDTLWLVSFHADRS